MANVLLMTKNAFHVQELIATFALDPSSMQREDVKFLKKKFGGVWLTIPMALANFANTDIFWRKMALVLKFKKQIVCNTITTMSVLCAKQELWSLMESVFSPTNVLMKIVNTVLMSKVNRDVSNVWISMLFWWLQKKTNV